MGVPASGDMYVHRVGCTGLGGNKTGRGDLVLCSWEMGFMKSQLRSMPLKPLTTSALQEQTRELVVSKDAETAAKGKEPVYSLRLAEIDPICRTIANGVGQAAAHETFMAQVGFHLGRVGELGLNKDEVVSGLRAWTREVFGLDQPPILPYSAQMRLGRSGSSSYGRRSGDYGSTSYGSSDSNRYTTPRGDITSSQYGSRDRPSYGYGSSGSRQGNRGGRGESSSSAYDEFY